MPDDRRPVTSRLALLAALALTAGCASAPPLRQDPRGPGASAEDPATLWPRRMGQAEGAYRAGLDAYNAAEYSRADSLFSAGLDRLDDLSPETGAEMDVRRRDLLRTKLSYFLRQARERRAAAAALAQEIQREEARSSPVPFSDYPLEMNARVLRQLEFFRDGIHDRIQTYLTRSGRYAPLIRKELRDNGLPEDLIYLSLIESGFSPNAYSRAHAVGLWQFIQSTGRLYGLKVDKWVDERRDPEKATRAAVRHLRDLYETFGDWHLALAAYNCGEARVSRAIERQGTRDFWRLDLPQQTEEYVPRFIAAAYIGKAPEAHGFRTVYDPPIEKETITVSHSIRLSRLAEVCGTTVAELRALNPSLRREATPPYRHGFDLHLPPGTGAVLAAHLETLSREPEPEVALATGGVHVVRRGETLSGIAARHGTTPQAIARANRMRTGSIIRTGQRLRIPEAGGAEETTVAAASPPRKSRARSSTAEEPPKPYREEAAGAGGAATGSTHVVRRGETIGKIAARYGVAVEDVLRWNGISPRARIYPGQKIRVYPRPARGEAREGALSAPTPAEASSYTVQRGDTLWNIAQRFRTTVEEIRELNRMRRADVLRPGATIRIPVRVN